MVGLLQRISGVLACLERRLDPLDVYGPCRALKGLCWALGGIASAQRSLGLGCLWSFWGSWLLAGIRVGFELETFFCPSADIAAGFGLVVSTLAELC